MNFRSLVFLLLLFLLSDTCQGATTPNYNVLYRAAAAVGQTSQLRNGGQYALYEQSRSDRSGATQCITGWTHIRLIGGQIFYTPATPDSAEEWDFQGTAYDLAKDNANQVSTDIEPWRANSKYVPTIPPTFVPVSPASFYTWAGLVSATDPVISAKGRFRSLLLGPYRCYVDLLLIMPL